MRILFITSNRIGDAVLSTGLLSQIIREHPESQITLACGPVAAGLFSETPNLVQVIKLEKQPGRRHWVGLWREAARTRWDLVIDLRASAIAWFLRAKRRKIFRPSDAPVHRVLQLSDFYGLSAPAAPGLWFGEKQVTAAKQAIPPGDLVLAVGPTANWGGKQWAAGKFAEVVLRLTAPGGILPDARVAVFGAESERKAALPLLERIPKRRRIDLVGRFDVLTAAACLQECGLYVGNDSGLMHLAAATYTPTLGLFGPSRDDHYAPWGEHCAAVRAAASYRILSSMPEFRPDRHDSLMDSLSVEAVEAAAIDLWQRCHPEREASAIGAR